MPRRQWTEREIEIIRRRYPRDEVGDIALQLNCSKRALRWIANKNGINKFRKKEWTTDEIAFVCKNYKKTTRKHIARALGRSVESVSGVIARQAKTKQMRWTAHRQRKIIALWRDGLLFREIAERMGCTTQAVKRQFHNLRREGRVGYNRAETPADLPQDAQKSDNVIYTSSADKPLSSDSRADLGDFE